MSSTLWGCTCPLSRARHFALSVVQVSLLPVLDIRPEIQAELARQAAAHGLAVETYAATLLESGHYTGRQKSYAKEIGSIV